MPDDHERLLAVAAKWERLNSDKDVEIAELKRRVVYAETEVERLRTALAAVNELPCESAAAAAVSTEPRHD